MAGSSFGGTIKLSKEEEYKKALREITNNLKVMSSEMKVVTSAYDKNDKSTENLSAQNEILNKKIEEQSEKVKVLTTALNAAKKETGESSTTTKKWQNDLNLATAELNSMQRQVKNNEEAMKNARKTTDENADSVKKFGDEADKSGASALSMGDIIKANLISSAITSGLKNLASMMGTVAGSIGNLMEETKEYNTDLANLEQNAKTNNNSFDLMKDKLYELEAITGETDSTIEGLSNLMATGLDDDQMTRAIEGLSGAIVKFPDTLKFESLSDSLQETIATSSATGQFSELIERCGGSLDDFNAGLEECADSTERQEYALKWLAESGLPEINQEYQNANAGALQLARSQSALTGAQAELGKSLTNLVSNPMSIMNNALATLASSFANVLDLFLNGDFEEGTEMLSESLIGFVESITEDIEMYAEIGSEIISALIDGISNALPTILETGASLLTNLLNGIVNSIPQIMPVVLNIINTLVNTLVTNLPTIINAGIQILVSLIQGLAQSIPDLVPTIVDAVITIVNTLIDNIGLIIDAGIDIMFALIDGIISAVPDLVVKIPEIIGKLISAIMENLPKILSMGVTLSLKLAEGLIKGVPQILSKIPEMVTSIKDGFVDGFKKMVDVGKNVVQGIWDGITGSLDWIKDKIKGWVGNVFKFIKKLFGINSPSTLFRDEIGTNLAKGIGVGFEDAMPDVNKEIMNAIPTDYDVGVNTNINSNAGISSNVIQSQNESMALAIKDALRGMHVVLDGDVVGQIVVDTIENEVYT